MSMQDIAKTCTRLSPESAELYNEALKTAERTGKLAEGHPFEKIDDTEVYKDPIMNLLHTFQSQLKLNGRHFTEEN
jgi:hypothetical protein